MQMVRKDDLTLTERAELEQFTDGTVTAQMVADKIAQRPTPLTHEQIIAKIRELSTTQAWYMAVTKTERSDYMRKWDAAKIAACEREIARLDAMLEGAK